MGKASLGVDGAPTLRRRAFLGATALVGASAWRAPGGMAATPATTPPANPANPPYDEARRALLAERIRLFARWRAGERAPAFVAECERVAAKGVQRLASFWIGTTWGLGAPQIERPDGRVNCGTFVGRLLADAGFEVPPERVRRFSRFPFARLVEAIRGMGPGLPALERRAQTERRAAVAQQQHRCNRRWPLSPR